MQNDFEMKAMRRLSGLSEQVDPQALMGMLPQAMNMLPGVSGPDDQLQAMAGMIPEGLFAQLAGLLTPPPMPAGGVGMPSTSTGMVRPQALPPVRQAAMTGRPNMDAERAEQNRRAQRQKADREQAARQAKKKRAR